MERSLLLVISPSERLPVARRMLLPAFSQICMKTDRHFDRRPFDDCSTHAYRRTCMLMVTHGCNLNCTYCYEKFKNGAKQMDVALAKEIITREIETVQNDERFREIEVDFMGGEPLLRFDLIKEVMEWMEQSCPVPYIGFATTNGTLLNDEMKDWFRLHRHTTCLGVSYDGAGGDSQGVNRGRTAESVDLDFFRELWPDQGFKMTLSKESLPYLYDSLTEAARCGDFIEASLAHGVDWDADDARLYAEQLRKLSDFYLEHPEYDPSNLLTRPLLGIGERTDYQVKFCGSGTYMATYDVDGTLYGCHMFTPLVLGSRALKHADFSGWDRDQELTDPACRGCGMMQWCPTCIGFNLKDRGAVNLRDHRWCAMSVAQAMAACRFQIEYFSRLTREHELHEREVAALEGALAAYDYLSGIDINKPFPQ